MAKAIERIRTLEECESTIERGLQAFWEVGESYRHIRDHDLYKSTHSTWAAYCRERWGMHKDTVNNVIRGTETRKRLAAGNDDARHQILPTTEYQIRPLSRLPERQQPAAWREAVRVAAKDGELPTHDTVKLVVERRRVRPTPRPPTPEELAYDAAKKMRDHAEGFTSSVVALMAHIPNLSDAEAQGCAFTIISTMSAVQGILEEHGHTPEPEPGLGVHGSTQTPEAKRVEVVPDQVEGVESRSGARPTVCQSCGKLFVAPRSDAKYCGQVCRSREYKKRKAAKA